VGESHTLCTRAIPAAVNTCAESGGGKVFVPPGKYLTGPICLKSNLEFEVLAGATLIGSMNFADDPTIHGWWEGLEEKIRSVISASKSIPKRRCSKRAPPPQHSAQFIP
jgi:polygalacturonase